LSFNPPSLAQDNRYHLDEPVMVRSPAWENRGRLTGGDSLYNNYEYVYKLLNNGVTAYTIS